MSGRFEGKKAIVTGGSRGIGAAIAARLAAEGADVVITYGGNHDAARATVARLGPNAHAIQANARDQQAVAASIEEAATRLGAIDILIHSAGVAQMETLGTADAESYHHTFDINVEAIFTATTAAFPHLRDGGRIIIIGSINAHAISFQGGALYGASKAAVAQMARGWARDLGPRGILVNTVQPGPVDTDMNPADGEFAKRLMPGIAVGRYGRVEEIAALTAFLASDEASYITGASIDIDGGLSL